MDFLTIAQDLIRMDSSTSSERTIHIAKYLQELLSAKGFECNILKKDKYANLIATYGKNPELTFSGHMDTVDPDLKEWSFDPWKPYIENKKLYGLGSCDMKSQIAVIVSAVIENKLKMKKGCNLIFTYGEENNFKGIKEIPSKYFKGKYCIVCEPSNLTPVFAHKGVLKIELFLYGKSAHGSTPDKGVNALTHIMNIYKKIEELNKTLLTKENSILGKPRHNLGVLRGGRATNIVPSRAVMKFEYRAIPELLPEEIRSRIEALVKSYCKENSLKYDLDFPFILNPFLENKNSKLGLKLKEITKKDYIYFNGATESPIFQSHGIETFVFGPGKGMEHKADEYVEIPQLKEAGKMYSEIIKHFC